MHPEAVFLAGYALTLVAVAAGLESLGRRSTHPWASRTLAACRPPDEPDSGDVADWPHSEVPVFHTGVSGVALAAALALTIVSIARHHDPVELAAQGVLVVLIGVRVRRLITRHRTLVRDQQRQQPTIRVTLASPEGGHRGRNAHDAMTRLRTAGYLADFDATDDGHHLRCGRCGARQDPEAMTVHETVRFKGDSNPDDEAILFALACSCGCLGQYSAAFGPATPVADVEILHRLARPPTT